MSDSIENALKLLNELEKLKRGSIWKITKSDLMIIQFLLNLYKIL
ncbi:hypothetical protein NEILACOT_05017 [Neisseria lactamica ATCC 23970]|uniref:Uncharacterized protein n=1 Tax=Neisseria lactamica ATCC 23970 TaxID=546265 RepID=D0WBU0_NEILA|nr:hypothetical protein NEILACOT_05017 [Neisseria lactamica ATCC 23970]